MAFVRERFTVCERNAGITDAFLNANYAARIVSGGDLINAKPAVNLVGSAANANEVYGEIKGALNSETCTLQTCGIMYLRTSGRTVTQLNANVGQGVQAVGGANQDGFVENTGTLGVGFGRILGGLTLNGNIVAVVDADAKG